MPRHITPEMAKAQAVKDATRELQTSIQAAGQRPINAPRGNINKTRTSGATTLGERIRRRPTKRDPRERPATSGIGNLVKDLLTDEEEKKEDEKGKVKVGELLYDIKTGKALPPRPVKPIPQEDLPNQQITDKTQQFLDDPSAFATEDFQPRDRSLSAAQGGGNIEPGFLGGIKDVIDRPLGSTLDSVAGLEEFVKRGIQFPFRKAGFDPSAIAEPAGIGIQQALTGGQDLPFIGPDAQPGNILEQLLQGALGLSPAQERQEARGFAPNINPLQAPRQLAREQAELPFIQQLGAGLPLEAAVGGIGAIAKGGLKGAARTGLNAVGPRGGAAVAAGEQLIKRPAGIRDAGTDLLGASVRRGAAPVEDVAAATKKLDDSIKAAAAARGGKKLDDVATSGARGLDEVTAGQVKTLRQTAADAFKSNPTIRNVSETFGRGTTNAPAKVSAADIEELNNLVKADTFLVDAEKTAASAVLKNIQGGEFIHDVNGLGNLGEIFGEDFVKNVLRNAQHKASMWDQFIEIGNIPRTILTSFDLSAPLRQGVALSVGNRKQFWDAFKMMFRAAKDENMARALDINMRRDVDFVRFTKRTQGKKNLDITDTASQGVEFSRREEAVASAIAVKIPGVKQSQQAYLAFLNKLRFDTAKSIVKGWEDTGTVVTDDMLDALFDYINRATGRGPKLGPDKINEVANIIFFSPRLFTSRVFLPLSMLRGAGPVKKLAQKQLMQALAAGSTIAMLASMTGAADVELDPRSSAFGKIKVGAIQHDIWAGYTPLIRYTAQLATGQQKAQGTKAFSSKDRGKTALSFLRSKLSPIASSAVGMTTGKDFLGREFIAEDNIFGKDVNAATATAWDNLAPLFVQELEEVVDEVGWNAKTVHALPSFFGTGVGAFKTAEDVAQDSYGVAYTTLWPFEQDLTREALRMARGINEGTEYSKASDQINQAYKDNIAAIAAGANSTNKFFMMQSYNKAVSDRYVALGQLGLDTFGPRDGSYQPVWGGSQSEQDALTEYHEFNRSNTIPGTSLFNFSTYSKALSALEAKWKAEGTLEYVQANTHKEEVPPVIFAAFNDAKRTRWVASHNARQKRNKTSERHGERPEGSIRSIPSLGPVEFPLNPETEKFLEQGGAPTQDKPSTGVTASGRRKGGPFEDDSINELARQFNIPISR